MSKDMMLTAASVKTNDDGFIATGPVATDAKLDAIIAALTAGGIVFDPDIDIGDVNLLNAAGDKQNPATLEGQGIATILAAWFAAVDATATGKTLATLKGSALNAATAFIRVRPQYATDDVRYNPTGSASATSALLPPGGLTFPVGQAAALKLFSTVGANISADEI